MYKNVRKFGTESISSFQQLSYQKSHATEHITFFLLSLFLNIYFFLVNFTACRCPPTMTCPATSLACPATCNGLNPTKTCTSPDVHYVCACPPGTVLYNDQCIPPTNCGCVDDDGKAHNVRLQSILFYLSIFILFIFS